MMFYRRLITVYLWFSILLLSAIAVDGKTLNSPQPTDDTGLEADIGGHAIASNLNSANGSTADDNDIVAVKSSVRKSKASLWKNSEKVTRASIDVSISKHSKEVESTNTSPLKTTTLTSRRITKTGHEQHLLTHRVANVNSKKPATTVPVETNNNSRNIVNLPQQHQQQEPEKRDNNTTNTISRNTIKSSNPKQQQQQELEKRDCCHHYFDHGHDLMEMHNNPHHEGSDFMEGPAHDEFHSVDEHGSRLDLGDEDLGGGVSHGLGGWGGGGGGHLSTGIGGGYDGGMNFLKSTEA